MSKSKDHRKADGVRNCGRGGCCAPVSLLGAVVECSLALHQGRWMVFEDMGAPSVRIQRPQDFRGRWVDRKFLTVIKQQAPNDEVRHSAGKTECDQKQKDL